MTKTYIRPNLSEKDRELLLSLLSDRLSSLSFSDAEFRDLFAVYEKVNNARPISTGAQR